jgi:hypothetical protein
LWDAIKRRERGASPAAEKLAPEGGGGFNPRITRPYKGEGGHPDLWGFGDGKRAFFWIKQGKPDPASIHWGFMAENKDKVDEFYRAAISAGARVNISPRARLEYYPGYYAADVFDPDGYSFEVVNKS